MTSSPLLFTSAAVRTASAAVKTSPVAAVPTLVEPLDLRAKSAWKLRTVWLPTRTTSAPERDTPVYWPAPLVVIVTVPVSGNNAGR